MARRPVLTSDPLIRRFMEESLPRIREEFHPSQVRLFGSRVRGDALEHSDLDVVLVSRQFQEIDWVDRAAAVLKRAHIDCWIEFLCYTPDEFRRKRREIGIVQAAIEEGVRVV